MTRQITILVVVVVIAAGSLGRVQAQKVRVKADPTYAPARTTWGDPDLQGVWSYNDDVSTPFERASELGTKAEFGDEELSAVLAERARRDVERAPTIGGETGAGPTHWYEFWNRESRRTSKVIDP